MQAMLTAGDAILLHKLAHAPADKCQEALLRLAAVQPDRASLVAVRPSNGSSAARAGLAISPLTFAPPVGKETG